MASGQVDEGLGAGRALALVLAAVASSVAASLLLVGGESSPAALDAPAAPDSVAGGDEASTVQTVSGRDGPAASGDSVIPDLVPKEELPAAPDDERNVAAAPEMPPPATRSEPAVVDVAFEVVENVAAVDPASGTEFETWGYRVAGDGPDGVVVGTPGPVVRARVGDVLRFTITNPPANTNPHNVDFHAVTGQGGGAEATTVAPGETRTIEARLLYPGFFMYHCAYGDVPAHIAHGMYGGILVDPATPLSSVDNEWYVVQSEYYLSDGDGVRDLDRAALTAETPTNVVFNGAVGALTDEGALRMQVGERSRIYFVNAGLNLVSSFHPIGSHWDRVYPEAALLNEPLRGSQTTLVPAGGGTVVEILGQVPQTVVLVDHALSRAFDKGAIGHVVITGDDDPEIFEEVDAETTGVPDPVIAERRPRTPEPQVGGGTTSQVAILSGSGQFQDLDSADEFASDEDPADYSDNVVEIRVGDTVTWTNQDDSLQHTATSADGTFDSGLLGVGDTFSWTFTEPGEFEYFCTPHPWMRAKVIVTA